MNWKLFTIRNNAPRSSSFSPSGNLPNFPSPNLIVQNAPSMVSSVYR